MHNLPTRTYTLLKYITSLRTFLTTIQGESESVAPRVSADFIETAWNFTGLLFRLIDVKNINLQIKNIKNVFLHFYNKHF